MSDVIDDIVDVIKKPIKWIGDTISDIGDWVVDEIIDPVVTAVTDVVDAVIDDPIRAIAYAAAAASGQWWALPLVSGADAAIQGGDIGDILEASAKGYIAGQAAGYGAKYGAQAASSAGASATAAQIIGAGTGSAASAVVRGEDPVKAFVTGGVQAGVQAGLGYIDEKISGGTSGSTGSAVGDPGGVGDPGPVGQTQSFLDQNPIVKNIVADTMTAALSGKDITGDVIMGAVVKGAVTTETVKKYIDADGSLTDGQIAAITTSVHNVANATFTGGDVSDTIYASLNAYGAQELNKVIDKNVKNSIDKITGDYQKAEAQANKIDAADKKYRDDVRRYNATVNGLQNMINERDKMKADVDAARANLQQNSGAEDSVYGPLVDAYNAKVERFNSYSKYIDDYYANTFKPYIDASKKDIDSQFAAIEAESAIYQDLKNELVSSSDQLDDVMIEVDNATQKAYVRAMTDDSFNVEEYKQVNGLTDLDDDEARFHWLTKGKDEDLPVNAVQYEQVLDNALASSMNGTLEVLGLSITDLTPEQIKSLREQTLAYGEGNLQSLKDIENGSAAIATTFRDNIGKNAAEKLLPAEQLQSELDYYGASSYDELPNDRKIELTNAALKGQKNLPPINKPDNVSDFDILTGKAGVSTNAEGLMNWEDVSLKFNIPKWDSRYGTVVKRVAHPDGLGEATVDMQGNYLNIGSDGKPMPELTIYAPLQTLKETNAGSYLDTLANVSSDAVDKAVEAGVAGLMQQYEFAKNVATYIANTETAQSIANSDFGKNTAGVVLDAGGELLDSMNNLVLLAGINPESTPLGKTAKNLIAMAGDMKTEEYKAAAAEIQETIGKANFDKDGKLLTNPDGTPLSTFAKAWNTIKAIGGAAMANPGTFASEYIAKELLQEIPVLIASGGTANVVKAGLKQAGEEFAQKMSQRAAIGTAGVLDVSESFGGTAGGAYDDAYATAIKSGMPDAEAQEYALDKAITAGTIAAVTTVATMGVGGNDFEKAIFNGKRGKNLSEAFDVMAKEAGQEAVEEGLPQAYLESQLYQLDPTRDVVGNVVSNSVLGALSGGTVAGSIYGGAATGDVVSNAMIMFNPEVRKVVQNEGGLDAAGVTQQLNDLGISDNTIQSNILNQVFDTDYTSTGEAEQAAATYVTENNIPYQFTKDELTGFTGANADADLAALVDNFVDPRYLDSQEIINAAAAEGVTLTEQQAADYVGQKDEAQETQNLQTNVFDEQATTYEEAKQYLDDLGYNPTEDEINSFVEQVNETEQQQAITTYAEDRLTTKEEVITELENAGFDTSQLPDGFVEQFVKQGLQTDTLAELIEASDPLMVTAEEVLNAYEVAGLPDVIQEDIDALVGQYNESELIGKLEEALPGAQFNVLKAMLGKPPTDAQEATGIYAQLEQLISSGVAQDDAIQQISDDLSSSFQQLQDAGVAQDEAIDQISENVTNLETDLTGQIGDVETALGTDIQSIADIIGKPATEVTDVDVDFVADIIAQTEALSDPSTFQFTDEQLGYDVTGDGIVDINDQNLLNNALQGQDVAFAPESQFKPATGIFAQLDAQTQAQMDAQAQIQAQLDAQTQQQLDSQMQIAQQVEDEAKKRNVRDLQNMLVEDASRVTTVKSQPVAEIGDPYDFASIFRDSGQDAFYRSPYAQGGIVDVNEELLRLIGGK